MKTRKVKKSIAIYSLLGKGLCACAGGVLGFIVGGPLLALPGILLGSISGHLLEKGVFNPAA